MSRAAVRRVLFAPALLHPVLYEQPSRFGIGLGVRTLTSVVETSFWKSLVPKPLRRKTTLDGTKSEKKSKAKNKEWNPATFFIFIFLFIGSMSIQMISLRKDFTNFMRRADVRIGLLREVVEKLQKGEAVDVEKALGTGDPDQELEWEKVLKEIAGDDAAKSQRKKQPEPTQEAGPKREEPVPGSTRPQVQSTLATKGFF
ncbi:hypothetical protein VTK26DRAFT_8315 [Humicola hyalothermophila]